MTSLANLPAFLAYFAAAIALLAGFLLLFTWLTPRREWTLVRQGDTAAAVGLAGSAIGFCLPLASAIAHSAGWADMLVWALVALLAQLLCVLALRLLRPAAGPARPGTAPSPGMAEAVMQAGAAICVGLINAACLT